MKTGKLDAGTVFLGAEAWRAAKWDESAPQAYGYAMKNDADLVRLMEDAEAVADLREHVARTGEYPTIYFLNDAGRRAFEDHLTGWIPSEEERTAS